MEDLPEEILLNIFIRLLSRQLAQMRSVSKSWNGLLSHPFFVKSTSIIPSVTTTNKISCSSLYLPFTQFSCESPHLEPTDFIKHIPTNLPKEVIGAVNGLICLSEYSYHNIHIWNPSLSTVSAIPPPHSLIPGYYKEIRFGYDPKTDDYKLVKISGIYSGNFNVKEWLPSEVYSMRKGCWEVITQHFPSHVSTIYNPNHLCLDGHLHWENRARPMREHTILGFDLDSETFREMPLPDAILDSNHMSHQLGFLNGKLCEISWRKDGGWEVWVMEEYGVPESWVRSHVLSQFNGDRTFKYGFTSRNEFLLQDEDGRLVLYDPIADKTKSTRTKQTPMAIVEYVDSLVWIKTNLLFVQSLNISCL